MSSKTASDTPEMECGTSLAEDAWAVDVPSITDASSADGNGKKKGFYRNNDSSSSSVSVSVEEAWAKIHELRAKLASDVVSDPPPAAAATASSPNTVSSNPYNFPTFISPYETPNTNKTKGLTGNPPVVGAGGQSYKGMSIPLIYCDQTASQRPVTSIENYIREVSMPCHANTHTVRFVFVSGRERIVLVE